MDHAQNATFTPRVVTGRAPSVMTGLTPCVVTDHAPRVIAGSTRCVTTNRTPSVRTDLTPCVMTGLGPVTHDFPFRAPDRSSPVSAGGLAQ
jgi:hypothetical protein